MAGKEVGRDAWAAARALRIGCSPKTHTPPPMRYLALRHACRKITWWLQGPTAVYNICMCESRRGKVGLCEKMWVGVGGGSLAGRKHGQPSATCRLAAPGVYAVGGGAVFHFCFETGLPSCQGKAVVGLGGCADY